jgi:hypothetical protein
MTRARVAAFVAFVVLALLPRVALAHKPSDSYLTLAVQGARVDVRWDIALRDLDYAIGLDADGDGAIRWGEVRARAAAIDALALASLDVRADGAICAAGATDHAIVKHSDGNYVVVRFALTCPAAPRVLDARYSLFFDLDPQHRGLMRIDANGVTRALTFSAGSRDQKIDLASMSRLHELRGMVKTGVVHIWEGYDHVLFLLALLLPAVLRREDRAWIPVTTFRQALVEVLKVVTAFTVAHSITLSLAVLDVVRLPSRFVESGIAASVVVVALNNVFPIVRAHRWYAAFALGLLHGFGFSAALMDLDLPRESIALGLFGFNVGVEIGQAVIVAAFLPLAWFARRTVAYRRVALIGGSIAIGVLACVWLVERAFGIKLIS